MADARITDEELLTLARGPHAETEGSTKALTEPYERYRHRELRAECYRRGVRPVRRGPHANDNKAGYVSLLRAADAARSSAQTAPSTEEPVCAGSKSAKKTRQKRRRGRSSDGETTQDDDAKRCTRTSFLAVDGDEAHQAHRERCEDRRFKLLKMLCEVMTAEAHLADRLEHRGRRSDISWPTEEAMQDLRFLRRHKQQMKQDLDALDAQEEDGDSSDYGSEAAMH